MFRFTTRDLLWLMVVIGLALGWWIELRAGGRSQVWYYRAGAMEFYLKEEGKVVSYTDERITIFDKLKSSETTISGNSHPPTGTLEPIRE